MAKELIITKTGAKVMPGHYYNDTDTTQVQVRQINFPGSKIGNDGLILVREMSVIAVGWYDPSIIGAAWVEVAT